MSTSRRQPPYIDFAPNYGWVTPQMQQFKPREVTAEQNVLIATAFLRHDKDIAQLLRSSRMSSWIVSVVLGKDTAQVNIYNPTDVDASNGTRTQPAILERAAFFEMHRTGSIQPLDAERIESVKHTHAMLYSTRQLKSSEIRLLDDLLNIDTMVHPHQQKLLAG